MFGLSAGNKHTHPNPLTYCKKKCDGIHVHMFLYIGRYRYTLDEGLVDAYIYIDVSLISKYNTSLALVSVHCPKPGLPESGRERKLFPILGI